MAFFGTLLVQQPHNSGKTWKARKRDSKKQSMDQNGYSTPKNVCETCLVICRRNRNQQNSPPTTRLLLRLRPDPG